MNTSEELKLKTYKLFQRDAKHKQYRREYMKEYRRKQREQGIHEPSVISKNNTQHVYEYLYKQNAIKCIKYLFK